MQTLIQKLQSIQGKLKVPKNQRNNFGGYFYRSLEDIMEAAKPLLSETGTTITIADEIVMLGDRYYVKATVTFSDGSSDLSVSAFAREPLTKKGMDESQITGAASSYARKYAMNGLLAIDDTKDADATNEHDKAKAPDKPPKAKKAEAPELTEQNMKVLNSIFSYYENHAPAGYRVDADKFRQAVFAKYGKYPSTDSGAERVMQELDTNDIFVAEGNDK